MQSRISADGKWLAFLLNRGQGRSQIYVTPMPPRQSETEWIPISAPDDWVDKPKWSPNGNLLYFLSKRDGFGCIWAQKLNRDSKRAEGDPFPVEHFHNVRRSLWDLGFNFLDIAVTRDKLIFNMVESQGNVWMLSNAAPAE